MMMSRRNIIAATGGIAAVALAGSGFSPAVSARVKVIGIQLYTVRDIFSKDPAGTLEAIARVGYREVEFGGGGYEAMDHAMLRKTMDRLGLRAPSVHVGYEALLRQFEKSVTMAKMLGADTIVLPHMIDTHSMTQGWDAALPELNRLAADLQKTGLGFAYHNGMLEFVAKPGEVSLYDRLMRGTDPSLVKFELDLYWAIRAGADVGALIDRLAGRIYAYHVKDMRADRSVAAVGQGTIDLAALFKRRGNAGVRHFYVENEEAPAPYIPDITTSFQAMRALRF